MKVKIKFNNGEKLKYINISKVFNNSDILRFWIKASHRPITYPFEVIRKFKIKA